jgi:acyl transferase domain-containing protein
MMVMMSEHGTLSPDGSSKTFDADANGYARGEAINAIYIKRLDDALRDGNPIRAIIRSSATNFDGKTPGLSQPSAESQEALIRRAYAAARLPVDETTIIECHGTGTPVGDPLETRAVANVFGKNGVYITSVKPNLGHSEGASGITSLIKMVLALENSVIPPNIKFNRGNPQIPWDEGKLKVPTEAIPWPKDRKERVGINAFGIGGANAHIVLESAASFLGCRAGDEITESIEKRRLLVFSANHADSLQQSIASYSDYLQSNPGTTKNLAYTLACRREHLVHRTFLITNGSGDPLSFPSMRIKPGTKLAMVFTGQGAQWPRMGKELMEQNNTFGKAIRRMDKILSSLSEPAPWKIEGTFRRHTLLLLACKRLGPLFNVEQSFIIVVVEN